MPKTNKQNKNLYFHPPKQKHHSKNFLLVKKKSFSIVTKYWTLFVSQTMGCRGGFTLSGEYPEFCEDGQGPACLVWLPPLPSNPLVIKMTEYCPLPVRGSRMQIWEDKETKNPSLESSQTVAFPHSCQEASTFSCQGTNSFVLRQTWKKTCKLSLTYCPG